MTSIVYRQTDSAAFAPELVAYCDLLTQLVDHTGGMIADVNERNWKNAVMAAMRRLAKYRDWKYYTAPRTIYTNSDVTITASYDHTGGAYERLVTKTSGTLDSSWMNYGYCIIDSQFYEIEEYKSSTTFTLSQRSNPGADVSSRSMKIGRNDYPLPADFLKILSAYTASDHQEITPCSPTDLDFLNRYWRGSGTSCNYSIVGLPRFFGTQFFRVNPRTNGSIINLLYRRYARPLKHTGFDTNDTTGTVTTGGTNSKEYATLSGANESASMLGSIIRLRNDTNIPEGPAGKYPYKEQRIIVQVDTTNHRLYFDRPTDSTYAAKAYCISDPVDVAPHMLDALIAACRVEAAKQQPREGREISVLEALFQDELRLAEEADNSYPSDWSNPIVFDRMHSQVE